MRSLVAAGALAALLAVAAAPAAEAAFTHRPQLEHVAVRCMHAGALTDRVRVAYTVNFGDVRKGTEKRWAKHEHRARTTLELVDGAGRRLTRHRAERHLPHSIAGHHVRSTLSFVLDRQASRRVLRGTRGEPDCERHPRRARPVRVRLAAAQILEDRSAPKRRRGRAAQAQGTAAGTGTAQATTTVPSTSWGGLARSASFASGGEPDAGIRDLDVADFNDDGRGDVATITDTTAVVRDPGSPDPGAWDYTQGSYRSYVSVHAQDSTGAFPDSHRNLVMRSYASQVSWAPPRIDVSPYRLATGQMDADSRADLAILHRRLDSLSGCSHCGENWLAIQRRFGSSSATAPISGARDPGLTVARTQFLMKDPPRFPDPGDWYPNSYEVFYQAFAPGLFDVNDQYTDLFLAATALPSADRATEQPVLATFTKGDETLQWAGNPNPPAIALEPGLQAAVPIPARSSQADPHTWSMAIVHNNRLGVLYTATGNRDIQPVYSNSEKIGGVGHTMASGDFDADGAHDLVVGAGGFGAQGPRLMVLYNTGSPTGPARWSYFENPSIRLPSGSQPIVAAADVDANGCDDIVVADRAANTVRVFRSTCARRSGFADVDVPESFAGAGGGHIDAVTAPIDAATGPADVAVASGRTVQILTGRAEPPPVVPDLLAPLSATAKVYSNKSRRYKTFATIAPGDRVVVTGAVRSALSLGDFPGRQGFTSDVLGSYLGKRYVEASEVTILKNREAVPSGAKTVAEVQALDTLPAGTTQVYGKAGDQPQFGGAKAFETFVLKPDAP